MSSFNNGLQTWGLWQYFHLGEGFKFSTTAITSEMAKHRERLCREYFKNTDRLIASEETSREIMEVIAKKISSQTGENFANYERSTNKIVSSFEKGVVQILSGMSFLREDISDLREDISEGFANVTGAINGLRSDFNWFSNRIFWHLSDIKKSIQMPISNTALNYREHGIHAYQNGWIEEAYKDFMKVLNYYEYDFVTHQYLGDIYLYHYKNLNKALEHFSKAARYSATRDASMKQKKISSWAEVHVGLVHYLNNNFIEAAKAAFRAVEKHPSSEALYQLGHYLALTPQKSEMLKDIINTFEVAIRQDPVYFFKIDVDQKLFEKDLNFLRNEMKALKNSLFSEEKEKAWQKIKDAKSKFNSINWFTQSNEVKKMIVDLEAEVKAAEKMFFERQSYLDFRIIQEMI